MSDSPAIFDYIVTGADSAGCVVAARLSENGRHRVLLLEAGPPDTNPWIHIPLGFAKTYVNPKINWKFETIPQEQLGGRQLYLPRGKTLGGSSSINGMVYIRGNHGDYDAWRQRGCEGWNFDSVLPYFKKAENQTRGRRPDLLDRNGLDRGGLDRIWRDRAGQLARHKAEPTRLAQPRRATGADVAQW